MRAQAFLLKFTLERLGVQEVIVAAPPTWFVEKTHEKGSDDFRAFCLELQAEIEKGRSVPELAAEYEITSEMVNALLAGRTLGLYDVQQRMVPPEDEFKQALVDAGYWSLFPAAYEGGTFKRDWTVLRLLSIIAGQPPVVPKHCDKCKLAPEPNVIRWEGFQEGIAYPAISSMMRAMGLKDRNGDAVKFALQNLETLGLVEGNDEVYMQVDQYGNLGWSAEQVYTILDPSLWSKDIGGLTLDSFIPELAEEEE